MLVAVLIQTFTAVAVIMQFQVNRSYYAEVLCINKNRPELACQGKCVLMQRLNNEFEQEQQTTHRTLKNLFDREITLFYSPIKSLNIQNRLPVSYQKPVLNPFSKIFFSQCALSGVFHPPAHRA